MGLKPQIQLTSSSILSVCNHQFTSTVLICSQIVVVQVSPNVSHLTMHNFRLGFYSAIFSSKNFSRKYYMNFWTSK
uniref:Uncharacterized protein n=1 Tax=Oryza brachyantha TaxID=4533 RepID=J3L2T2_ORYBR